ncbi:MAG: dUTP diphosphatase [Proteobacteria bacterium]|nr:dUTP diphosphatase [Pseudomonadota bacterium]
MKSNAKQRALMVEKIAVMLEMQDGMNSRVDKNWIERDRQWYRALWIECAELMDHYGGWKWWKESHQDVEQVMLEIVDIWHFGLSMRITPVRDYSLAAQQIAEEWESVASSTGFLEDVETLANFALAEKEFLIPIIPALLKEIRRDFEDLYRGYVGKNVLNYFRQDHGYREGNYAKTWDGREDNEHLVEILATIDADDLDFRDQLYAALKRRYPGSVA